MITVTLTGKIVAVMAIISFICLGAVFVHYRNITNQIIAHQERQIKILRKGFDDLASARKETRKEFEKMTKIANDSNNLNERLIAQIKTLEKENETLKSDMQSKKSDDLMY